MKRNWFNPIVFGVLLLTLAACTSTNAPGSETTTSSVSESDTVTETDVTSSTARPTPTPDATLPPAQVDTLLAEIDAAAAEWQAMSLSDYRIVVTTISLWHMQTHTIVIRFGEITEATATCNPAPLEAGSCEVSDFDPQTFTVPGLFAQARAVAQSEEGRWTTIAFDPIYHFPNQISYTNPTLTDADSTWRVDEFQPLR